MEHGHLKDENDFVEGWSILIKQLKKVETDITIREFLDTYLPEDSHAAVKESFKKYVQGYDAADIKNASALSIRKEMENEDGDQFRIEKGYSSLINFLAGESEKNGCVIKTAAIVKQINWQKNDAEVLTSDAKYTAQKVIITVPVGVLRAQESEAGAIKFYPALREQQKAINDIGFGMVIKILLQFDAAFWFDKEFLKKRNINNPFFFFADTFIPTWWTQFPAKEPLLAGWLAGPNAGKYSTLSEDEFFEKSIDSLAKIFKMSSRELRERLTLYKICNWVNDPFCKGAYSYSTVATKEAIKILKMPVKNTLYFAGEALAEEGTSTVNAALQSGQQVSKEILRK